MNTCYPCNGTGQVQVIGPRQCTRCAGTGRDVRPGVGMDPFFPCSWCGGAKIVTETYYQRCNSCGGTGRR